MALIFCPGVSMVGELPADDAERVDRGVEGEDISRGDCGSVGERGGFEKSSEA